MAIVQMKRLRLVTPVSEQEELLKELLHIGCVEVETPSAEEAEKWGLMDRKSSALTEIRGKMGSLTAALETLDRLAPAKGKLLSARPLVTEEELFDQQTAEIAYQSAEAINRAEERLNQAVAAQTRLETQMMSYQPWKDLDMPLETESTSSVEMVLGVIPAAEEQNELARRLQEQAPLCSLITVSSDKDQQYVMLICHKEQFHDAMDVLKSCAFSVIRFKGSKGTAKENLARLQAQLEEQLREQQEAKQEIESYAEHRAAIKLVIDRTEQEISKEVNSERLLCSEQTILLQGWYTEPEEAELMAVLEKHPCAWETEVPSKEEYPNVPVQLRNNKLVKPLNMVTEMYSLPAYGSLDPNPLMAPFFVLFYGMMMADMGYGILMMLISLVVCKKARPRGNLFQLMGLCGVTTFLFGAVTGGFFGDFLTQLFKLLGISDNFALPALFTPLDDTLMILVGSFVLGAVHVITGMAINFYKLTKRGQFWDAVMDVGSWWLLFAGIGVGVLAQNWMVAIAGVAALILTQGRSAPTIIGKLVGGVSSLYDITGYFGDILSYSRLMALMLAGSVIAQVFNTLGAIPGNLVVFILISLVGNALNFALNVLGCYVHTLRLQCLEFFGKFYEDGGKPFQPLAINTKYVDMVKK